MEERLAEDVRREAAKHGRVLVAREVLPSSEQASATIQDFYETLAGALRLTVPAMQRCTSQQHLPMLGTQGLDMGSIAPVACRQASCRSLLTKAALKVCPSLRCCSAGGGDVLTPRQAYSALKAEGYRVDYVRTPLTDGAPPREIIFDTFHQACPLSFADS